jgi:N-glycosylase/DNA lyase
MPIFYLLKGDALIEREVPPPEATLVPGVCWGRPDVLFTPAYWMTQYWMNEEGFDTFRHRLGETFEEEVVACLLGGHGIPAEVGIHAFHRLRNRDLIGTSHHDPAGIAESLREPLIIDGRSVRYRFWSQKARYISAALNFLHQESLPMEFPVLLRNTLMKLPGIGPKTASWIVRNWCGSDEVAILDIHVIRAGILMKLFSTKDRPERNYLDMERRFLNLAHAINTSAANLDALIWQQMRSTPRIVNACMQEGTASSDDDSSTARSGKRRATPYQLTLH